jgi:hypothetical protein
VIRKVNNVFEEISVTITLSWSQKKYLINV